MQYRLYKFLGLFLAALLLAMSTGCGSDDFLDEPGNVYSGTITLFDVTGEDLEFIDTVQDDCDDDPVTVELEDYGPLFVSLTVSVDSSVAGLELIDYDIQYIPLSSPLSGGGTVVPVALEDNISKGGTSFTFPSGTALTVPLTFMSTQTKEQYRLWWVSGAPQNTQLGQGRYRFRLTCYFEDDNGVDREEEFERTVFLGNVDNCS